MPVLDLNPRLKAAQRERRAANYPALHFPAGFIAAHLRLMLVPHLITFTLVSEAVGYFGMLAREVERGLTGI